MFTNEKTNKLIKSMCEVNIDGKMGLLSLYDDLPHFEYDLTIDNVSIMYLYIFYTLILRK